MKMEEKIYKNLNQIIEEINSADVKVISFDVFDTLLLRPVPGDDVKFGLLDKEFNYFTGANISFSKIRMESESKLRRRIIRKEIELEDVTLQDIYKVMVDSYKISEDIADTLMAKELEIEYSLCYQRKSGKYLFDVAKNTGKKIVIASDMYLSKEVIDKLLVKNGYEGYDEIFVSSQLGLRKITGNLYRRLLSDVNVSPKEVLHIGDNYDSDVKIPENIGIKACYFPSTYSTYSMYGCNNHVNNICRDLVDIEKANREKGISIFRQMSANKYFDDPFREFDRNSDYNGDPYFVGYSALGPEVFALVKWIVDNMKRDQVSNMTFLSRDGYLPMKVYEIYREYCQDLPRANYLYVSRIALLPAMIKSKLDLFELPVDISYQTPRKLLKLLEFCGNYDMDNLDSLKNEISRKFDIDKSLDKSLDKESYIEFISYFIDELYDEEKHQASVEKISKYIKNSGACPDNKSAVFDMGYSGRIAAAIGYAIRDTFPVYFFHGDGNRQFSSEMVSGLNIRCFLDFNPYMEASLREYSYLEPNASCIGYDENLMPLFDKGPADGYTEAAMAMQAGAMDFVRDYLKYFYEYEDCTGFRNLNAAMAFEAFIRYCSEADKKIYDKVLIDDELWGGRRDIDLKKLMEARISKLPNYVSKAIEGVRNE